MTPADILNRAADVLETRGWFQGTWYPGFNAPDGLADPADNCEVCALAAINVAAEESLDQHFYPSARRDSALALADQIGIEITEDVSDEYDCACGEGGCRYCDEAARVAEDIATEIGGWNDDPRRTRNEVVTALRAAAASLRQNTTEGTS